MLINPNAICSLNCYRPLPILSSNSKFWSLSHIGFRFRCTALAQPFSVKILILVETGHIGRQASGAVTVTYGETIVYTTVCLFDVPSKPSDFFPLYVNYQERFSAAGQTSGGFFKREGRTKDHEVLICRLIDRPLHPTILKGFYDETQILSWVLSYEGLHSPDSLAITAAGIAVALSEVPNSKTVAGVRISLVGDKFIVNPTTKEMEDSELDLLLAGTDSAILMIEGYCEFLSEEKLLQAVEVGQVILSPDADPPVVKIMDYNKYRYEQQKRKRDQQKKSAASRMDLKELKMGYNIDQHDYSVRLKAARKFLKDGDKVKVIVNLKGRENEFRNIAIELIKRFQNDVGELGTEESKNFRDRNIAIVMVPNKAILQKAQEPPKKKDNSATESEVSASV